MDHEVKTGNLNVCTLASFVSDHVVKNYQKRPTVDVNFRHIIFYLFCITVTSRHEK